MARSGHDLDGLVVRRRDIRVRIVAPDIETDQMNAGHNPGVDPVIVALAQLVKDRWRNEKQAEAERRKRLTVIEGGKKS